MSKDYRRNPSPARRRDARRGTCAFWFLLGGVIGAFGVGYAWMTHEPGAAGGLAEEATTRPPAKPPQERKFDFYSMLPQEEVLVPAEGPARPPALPTPGAEATPAPKRPASASTAAVAPKPAEKPAATPAQKPAGSGGNYLLQVGSFRSTADAERLKAQLALKGIQTSIQTTNINGQTYYRVRTGAYDKDQAQSMRAKLEREGQESMMMRAP
jgi:cell division protein FtsN